jgi:hypothetical protein
MRRAGVPLLALITMLAAATTPAAAQFVRWTDERGNVHYGEGLDRVPERYRESAQPLGYRNAPAPAPSAAAAAEPTRETVIRYTPGQHIIVDARVGRRVVSAYEMQMNDVDGLLGQDFLARFNVQIDPTQGIVKLSPK